MAARAGHLKWIVLQILVAIAVMFETTEGLVWSHLVKTSRRTIELKNCPKLQQVSPKNANFFICEPNWMKFLGYISNQILALFLFNNKLCISTISIVIKQKVF